MSRLPQKTGQAQPIRQEKAGEWQNRRIARQQRRTMRQAQRQITIQLGKSLRAESGALVASLLSGIATLTATILYVAYGMKSWFDPVILFSSSALIVAIPALLAFIVGYSNLPPFLTAERFEKLVNLARSTTPNMHPGDNDVPRRLRVFAILRQIVSTIALAIVYGYTIFLLVFVILYSFNNFVGFDPRHYYLIVSVVFLAIVTAYFAYVTGATLTAKHLSMLLPLFVVAGVGVAGIVTPYQHWWTNNFSELGDNTTPAARLFDTTLVLAGICVIIISYFAVYELIASRQQYLQWAQQMEELPTDSPARLVLADRVKKDRILRVTNFRTRTIMLLVLLISSGALLAGVGLVPYSTNPILHNVFGRGMVLPIGIIICAMPWLAPELTRGFFFSGYLMAAVCSGSFILWTKGIITMVNVEGLLWLLYLLWFILFTRQAAALSQDRRDNQLLYDALGVHAEQIASPLEAPTRVSRGHQVASMHEAAKTNTSWPVLNGWPDQTSHH